MTEQQPVEQVYNEGIMATKDVGEQPESDKHHKASNEANVRFSKNVTVTNEMLLAHNAKKVAATFRDAQR